MLLQRVLRLLKMGGTHEEEHELQTELRTSEDKAVDMTQGRETPKRVPRNNLPLSTFSHFMIVNNLSLTLSLSLPLSLSLSRSLALRLSLSRSLSLPLALSLSYVDATLSRSLSVEVSHILSRSWLRRGVS